MTPQRIVLDTNILISALGWKGTASKIFIKIIDGEFRLITSKSLLDEFRRILFYPKFRFISFEEKQNFISLLVEFSELVEPELRLNVISQDQSDNKVLECAIAGKADCIISGDKHLLNLKEFGDIPILTLSKFMSLIS